MPDLCPPCRAYDGCPAPEPALCSAEILEAAHGAEPATITDYLSDLLGVAESIETLLEQVLNALDPLEDIKHTLARLEARPPVPRQWPSRRWPARPPGEPPRGML